jgi:hypothetical protein
MVLADVNAEHGPAVKEMLGRGRTLHRNGTLKLNEAGMAESHERGRLPRLQTNGKF